MDREEQRKKIIERFGDSNIKDEWLSSKELDCKYCGSVARRYIVGYGQRYIFYCWSCQGFNVIDYQKRMIYYEDNEGNIRGLGWI